MEYLQNTPHRAATILFSMDMQFLTLYRLATQWIQSHVEATECLDTQLLRSGYGVKSKAKNICQRHRVFGYAVATQWIRSQIEGTEFLDTQWLRSGYGVKLKAKSICQRHRVFGYAVDTKSNLRQRVFVKGTEFLDTQWIRSQIEGTEFLDAQWLRSGYGVKSKAKSICQRHRVFG